MEEVKKEEVLIEPKIKKVHKFRDTVLIRVERNIKDKVKKLSKERGWTMSWISDQAFTDFLNSLKPLN